MSRIFETASDQQLHIALEEAKQKLQKSLREVGTENYLKSQQQIRQLEEEQLLRRINPELKHK